MPRGLIPSFFQFANSCKYATLMQAADLRKGNPLALGQALALPP
jgi:hypothetical protein